MISGSLAAVSISRVLDRARHHLRRPVVRLPYLWDLTQLIRPEKRATLARSDTAIVIEGYPRSGNTYGVAAWEIANGRTPHVGRHLHGAPHVLRAVRLGVPTIVLVREPREAILSVLIRWNALTPHDAALSYLDFYRTVWPVRHRFVVGLFDRVITDFGALLEEVNERFGTSFVRYDHTPANEAAAFRRVDELNRLESGGQVVETHVGRPSGERARRKDQLRASLELPRTAAKLIEADVLYERYARLARERTN